MRILVAILIVLAAGFGLSQMLGGEAQPPVHPPGGSGTAATAEGDAHPAEAALVGKEDRAHEDAGSSSATERAAAPAQAIGLTGHALDHNGEPLGGMTIRLLRDGANEREALWAQTDARGAFAFDGVHGTFVCALWHFVTTRVAVEVPRGEHRHVTLRVAEPCVLVTGTVKAGTRPVADRTVSFHGKDVHWDTHTDDHGIYRALLRPGNYEISVPGPPTSLAWNIKGTTVWAEAATDAMVKEPLALAAVTTRVRRDLLLSPARIHVVVKNDTGMPVGDASVTIHKVDEHNRSWTRRTDASDGTITFAELPAGTWEIAARHDMHLSSEPRIATTRTGDGDQTVTITMIPAGALLVKFMQNGDLREPLDPSLVHLHIAGHEPRRGNRSEGPMWIYEGTRFDAVPVGTHEVVCADQTRPDGSIRFAPIEPRSPHRVTIEPGKTITATIEAVARPHLAISLAGEPDQETTIEVISTAGRVAPTHRGHDHWRAEVPAGDYTVVVHSGGREYREQVPVFRSNVDHTIQLLR